MNKRILKNILLTAFSVFFFIFSLALFIDSREKKDKSYATKSGKDLFMFKYVFNTDHMIGIIVGAILIGFSIYLLYTAYKNKNENPIVKPAVFGVISFIGFAYNLNCFISPLVTNESKFKDVRFSFYGSIVFAFISAYFVVDYLIKSKNAKSISE